MKRNHSLLISTNKTNLNHLTTVTRDQIVFLFGSCFYFINRITVHINRRKVKMDHNKIENWWTRCYCHPFFKYQLKYIYIFESFFAYFFSFFILRSTLQLSLFQWILLFSSYYKQMFLISLHIDMAFDFILLLPKFGIRCIS